MTDSCRLPQQLAFRESCNFDGDIFPANTMDYDTLPHGMDASLGGTLWNTSKT